jgi:hypothetical protein
LTPPRASWPATREFSIAAGSACCSATGTPLACSPPWTDTATLGYATVRAIQILRPNGRL